MSQNLPICSFLVHIEILFDNFFFDCNLIFIHFFFIIFIVIYLFIFIRRLNFIIYYLLFIIYFFFTYHQKLRIYYYVRYQQLRILLVAWEPMLPKMEFLDPNFYYFLFILFFYFLFYLFFSSFYLPIFQQHPTRNFGSNHQLHISFYQLLLQPIHFYNNIIISILFVFYFTILF